MNTFQKAASMGYKVYLYSTGTAVGSLVLAGLGVYTKYYGLVIPCIVVATISNVIRKAAAKVLAVNFDRALTRELSYRAVPIKLPRWQRTHMTLVKRRVGGGGDGE